MVGFHLDVRTVKFFLSYHSPHVRESRAVLNSEIHAEDSGFQVLDSPICQWNLDSGFQSLVGLGCFPDSKAQDSGFHKQNFPGFRNLDFLTWGDIIIPFFKLLMR